MANYRRVFIGGGRYFFTLVTERRQRFLTEPPCLGALRSALVTTRHDHPFRLDAIVVLRDHIHLLITLPAADAEYPGRIKTLKARFTRALPMSVRDSLIKPGLSKTIKHEAGVWQRRYWEHTIRNEADYQHHLDYMMFNPVKHGLVCMVADWRYSSFHRLVRKGMYPKDWGGTKGPNNFDAGE